MKLLPWVDIATGSLGQGLPGGVGIVLAGRYRDPGELFMAVGAARASFAAVSRSCVPIWWV